MYDIGYVWGYMCRPVCFGYEGVSVFVKVSVVL